MSTTASAAAAAGAFSSVQTPRLRQTAQSTVSFPPRSPPISLSVSIPCPPWARDVPPAVNSGYYNAKVEVDDGEGDVDGDELVRRFSREVSRAGVLQEIRWRRRHENARDKRIRKARAASRKYRRRYFKGPYPFEDELEPKEGITDEDENDNWEFSDGKFPYQ